MYLFIADTCTCITYLHLCLLILFPYVNLIVDLSHTISSLLKNLCFDIVLKRKGHTTANRIVTTLKYIYRTMSTCRNFWDKQVSTYIQKSTYCHFGGIQKSTSYCLGGTGIQRSWEIYKSPPIAILELYRSLTIVNFWVL